MTARELWQQRLDEIRAECNPHPPWTFNSAAWDLNRALRQFGAAWARVIAPVIDHVVRLVEDR